MRKKGILSILVALSLVSGLLAGCGSDKDKKDNEKENQARGRYVEKEIDLGLQDNEKAIGTFMQEGKIQVYTSKTQDDNTVYQSYVYGDGESSEAVQEDWMNQLTQQIFFTSVFLGRDGNIYAKGISKEVYGEHIYQKSQDGNESKDITPEDRLKQDENGYTDVFVDAEVLHDGTLCLASMSDNTVYGYKDGKEVFAVPTVQVISNSQEIIAASDEKFVIVDESGKKLDFYSAEDYKKTGSVDMEKQLLQIGLASSSDDNWYLMDTSGIHRFVEGGSLKETVMDASGGMMSRDNVSYNAFFEGEKKDFYALFSEGESGSKLQHYIFDENIGAVPGTVLNVYGLKKNATVSQAIYQFQHDNPDIKVEYSTIADENSQVTSEDIRTLNTELLGGNEGDVLILDDLPLESYIEKGILADISDMEDALKEKGVLMDVIGKTASKDGKMYAVPARISVPVSFGNKEAQAALENLDTLDTYLKNTQDAKLFGQTLHTNVANTLFAVMYEELVGKDGTMNEEKLIRLIKDWSLLCDNIGTKKLESDLQMKLSKNFSGFNTGELSMMNIKDKENVFLTEFYGLMPMVVPCEVMKQREMKPESVKGYYIPRTIAGIKASSEKKEIAREFILTLFADSVQESGDYSELPVTLPSLRNLSEFAGSTQGNLFMGSSYKNPETGEVLEIQAGNPEKSMIDYLIEMIQGLDKPFIPDRVAVDTFIEETEKCYEGTQSPEETAKAIVRKMDTYLSE